MRCSSIAFFILAAVSSTLAAPAPGFGFSSGKGGSGGNAISGHAGNANGGSVITTGYGWGPVVVGSGEHTSSLSLLTCFVLMKSYS